MTQSQYENIVIIGGSCAGHGMANELLPLLPKTHRIIIVDAVGYAFYPIAALRAAVVPGWEDKITMPLTTSTVFPNGTPHQVLAPNKVLELRENSLILQHPFEGSTELPFFKAVIATGAKQPSPMRPLISWSMEDCRDALRQTQVEVKQAKKIVIVGGGTVGIEFAGEVRAVYPDKSITIVHNHSSLLAPTPPDSSSTKGTKNELASWTSPPTHPKLSVALDKVARENNVELILNDRVIVPQSDAAGTQGAGEWDGSFGLQDGDKKIKLKSGGTITADFVFLSVGNKPNNDLVAHVDQGAVLSQGLIAVDLYLKVKSNSARSPLTNNYYSIGDCSSSPGLKTAYAASVAAKSAATNIVNEIKGKALVAHDIGTFGGLFVPFGPALGAGSMTIPYLGTWTVGNGVVKMLKGQKLTLNMWADSWKGSEKVAIDV